MTIGTSKTRWWKKLHWQVLIGMAVGATVGLTTSAQWAPYYSWVGEIFLKLLKMVVVPLVFSSIAAGVISLGNPREVGRIGLATVLYYLITSSLAIGAGLLVVNLFQPGVGLDTTLLAAGEAPEPATLTARGLLFRLIPDNPLHSFTLFGTDEEGAGYAMLAIIFFGVLFGLSTATVGGRTKETLLGILESIFKVMMSMTHGIIKLAPLGVAALVAETLSETGSQVFLPLLGYMLTVLAGLGIHFFLTLPAILLLVGGWNPLTYFHYMSFALATAFSTASSNATLPTTLECVEKNAGIDNSVSSFVIPLGATVNMDGTALYESVAAIFIANIYGVHLDLTAQLLIFVTALVTSIGAAGIPHSSMVMMTIIFRAVHIPIEGIGLILAVDRLLDMCRTTTNVWSDAVGTAVIDRFYHWLHRPASPLGEFPSA